MRAGGVPHNNTDAYGDAHGHALPTSGVPHAHPDSPGCPDLYQHARPDGHQHPCPPDAHQHDRPDGHQHTGPADTHAVRWGCGL